MSVLDKNIEPNVAYSDFYEHGSVYFSIEQLGTERSSETPFLKDAYINVDERCLSLPIVNAKLHECSIETLIATGLQTLFYTDAIAVQRTTPTLYDAPTKDIETFVAILGSGHYESHTVSSCRIVLRRKIYHEKSSLST